MNISALFICYVTALSSYKPEDKLEFMDYFNFIPVLPASRCEVLQLDVDGSDIGSRYFGESFKMPQEVSAKVDKLLTEPVTIHGAIPEEAIAWVQLGVDTKNQSSAYLPEIQINYEVQRILNMDGDYIMEFALQENHQNKLLQIYIEEVYSMYMKFLRSILEKN